MEVSNGRNRYNNLTKVCIDSYTDGVLEGRMYQYHYPIVDEGLTFKSTVEFLKCMEHAIGNITLEELKEKIASRTVEEEAKEREMIVAARQGKIATFTIRVLFQQHSTWQGTVMWIEKKKEERFRSVKELLLLMDSAMSLPKGVS